MPSPSALQHPIQGSGPTSLIRDIQGWHYLMSSVQLRLFPLIFKCSSRGYLPLCLQPSHLYMKWSKFICLLHMPNTNYCHCKVLSEFIRNTFRSMLFLIPPQFQRHFRNSKSLLLCSSWMVASSPAIEMSGQLESLSKRLLLPALPEMHLSYNLNWQHYTNALITGFTNI